ncbi:hypothetical protein EHF33_20575 (plasmid) [Deinococcus psychrotolerans]|uniref:Uncharacterized protein n=1 Tax=Deinococcus psychrotolerans TaxID=2489213 RepID=A0A3G8YM79_9DEIO|nr:hypothetical protein [Deinococcus psychrotolerans]AZI45307.1 hypothetical protein EHF33_20575 [Deinococcus psychrotolerans]
MNAARQQISTMCASLGLSIYSMEHSSAPLSSAEQVFVTGYRQLHRQLSKALNRDEADRVALNPVQLPLLRASLIGTFAYVQEYPADLPNVPEIREPLKPERLAWALSQVNDWIAHPPVSA